MSKIKKANSKVSKKDEFYIQLIKEIKSRNINLTEYGLFRVIAKLREVEKDCEKYYEDHKEDPIEINGKQYWGKLNKSKQPDYGMLRQEGNDYYVGQFDKGIPNGFGSYRGHWNQYQGSYVNDKFSGIGMFNCLHEEEYFKNRALPYQHYGRYEFNQPNGFGKKIVKGSLDPYKEWQVIGNFYYGNVFNYAVELFYDSPDDVEDKDRNFLSDKTSGLYFYKYKKYDREKSKEVSRKLCYELKTADEWNDIEIMERGYEGEPTEESYMAVLLDKMWHFRDPFFPTLEKESDIPLEETYMKTL